MYAASFQRRADDAVKTGSFCVFRVLHHDLCQRLFDEQLALHARLVDGGQLRDRDEKRPRAVRAGQAFDGGLHHVNAARGVQIADVHVQTGQNRHRLFDGVGDVVQLEIQKNLVAARLDGADDRRALSVEQLHADLHERLFPGEAVEETESILRAFKVTRDDNVFSH